MIKGMGYEESFVPPQEAEEQQRLALASPQPEAAVENTTYDNNYFLDTFGLGPEETTAIIHYDGRVATVGAMLTDPKCPVGKWVAKAYETGGAEALTKKIGDINALSDGDVGIQLSERTRAYHDGSLSRDTLLAQSDEARAPDFLAQVAINS